MEKMYLNVGDWSQDGHNQYKQVLVTVNKTVDEIRQAYKDSCKLTGISFNHNEDYTGLKLGYDSPFRIATEYENSVISSEAMEVLSKFGITFEMDEGENEYYIGGVDEFTRIWFQFVTLSLPDLVWSSDAKPAYPSINGFWNDGLNCQFGYGLFC